MRLRGEADPMQTPWFATTAIVSAASVALAGPLPARDPVSASQCGRTKIPITPTAPEKGKKYGIVESASFPRDVSRTGHGVSEVTWLYEKKQTGVFNPFGF
jgi:hypothetical protein